MFVGCNFFSINVVFNIGNISSEHCNVVSALVYRVENSTFDWTQVLALAHSHNSFAFMRFSHVLLNSSYLAQYDAGGYVAFYLENCTFLNIGQTAPAIFSPQTSYMNISHCYFKLIEFPVCELDGCVIHSQDMFYGSDLAKKLFYPTCTTDCVKIEIHNTQFIGTPETNKFIIKTALTSLFLNQSRFNTGNQNRSSTRVAFVNSVVPYKIVVIETIFDASEFVPRNDISFMVTKALGYAKYIRTHILCPETYRPIVVVNDEHIFSYIVSCKEACEIGQYMYGRGNMIINGTLDSNKGTNS